MPDISQLRDLLNHIPIAPGNFAHGSHRLDFGDPPPEWVERGAIDVSDFAAYALAEKDIRAARLRGERRLVDPRCC